MRFSTNFWDNALFGGDGAGGDGDSSPSITGYSVDPNTGSRSVTNSAGATTTWDASGNQTVSYGAPSSSGSSGGSSTTTQAPAQTAAPAKAPAQTTTAPAVTAAPAKTEAAPAPAPAQTTAAPASLDPAPTTTSGLASAAPAATGSLSSSSVSGLTSGLASASSALGGLGSTAAQAASAVANTAAPTQETTTAVSPSSLGTTASSGASTASKSSNTGSTTSQQSTSYTPSAREAENTSMGAYEAYDLSSTFGANNPHSNYDSTGNYSAPADYTTTSTGTGYNVSNYDPLGSARGLMSGANDPVSDAVASPSRADDMATFAAADKQSMNDYYASQVSSNSLGGSLANTAPSGTFTGTASLAAPTAVETGIPSYDSINSYARDIQANSRVDTPVTQTTSTAINSTNVVDPRSGYAPTSGLLSSPYSNGSREFTENSSRVFSDIMGTVPKDDFSSRAALDATSLTAPGTSSFSTTGQPATSSQAALNAGATSRQASVTDIGTKSTASPMYSPDRQAWDPQNTFESAAGIEARGVTTSSLPGIAGSGSLPGFTPEQMAGFEAAKAGIFAVEATKGAVNPYESQFPSKTVPGLTEMTIAEAMAYQKSTGNRAMGAYQFTPNTLERAVRETGIPTSEKFSEEVQDYLGGYLMQDRANQATVAGEIDVSKFGDRLAAEWAGLAAPSTGKSYYDGDKYGNKSGNKASDTLAIAQGLVDSGFVTANGSYPSWDSSKSAAVTADQMADLAAANTAPDTGKSAASTASTSTANTGSAGTATATPISDAYSYDPTQGIDPSYVYDQNTAPGNPVAGLLGGLANNPNGLSPMNAFTNAVVGSQLYQGFNALYDATIGKMDGTTGPSEQPSFDGSVGADTNAFSSLTPPEEETTEVDPEERFEETYLFWSPYRPTPTFRF